MVNRFIARDFFSFNRTILELKSIDIEMNRDTNHPFNRTILELKYYYNWLFEGDNETFNRTILELKFIC